MKFALLYYIKLAVFCIFHLCKENKRKELLGEKMVMVLIVVLGIAFLLLLVLKCKLHAFIALLIASIAVGVAAGMPLTDITASIQNGMGGTLGTVAIIVGLGAVFDQMLEASGGAQALAKSMIRFFGEKHAPLAFAVTGFIIAIPVFFDVGFIILLPLIYAVAYKTKRSVATFAFPLIISLCLTNAFVPPTPGPVATCSALDANVGWVIFFGIIISIPLTLVGYLYSIKYIDKHLFIPVPDYMIPEESNDENLPSFSSVILIIAVPILLILVNTGVDALVNEGILADSFFTQAAKFLGTSYIALLIAVLLSFYILGKRRGFHKEDLYEISSKAFLPVGLIILVTGAGGVFKQILLDSGVGDVIAQSVETIGLPPIILGYLVAVFIRVSQGSGMVAMITAAGIVSPLLAISPVSEMQRALVVLAIAAGSVAASHVNDSGFWLVCKYLNMTEGQTLKTWTFITAFLSLCSLVLVILLSLIIP